VGLCLNLYTIAYFDRMRKACSTGVGCDGDRRAVRDRQRRRAVADPPSRAATF
jgi:hypothetical protein